MKKILHILAQKPGKTGSGVCLNSIVEQADKKGHSQAVICGVSQYDELNLSKVLKKTAPVYFETEHLPFPVAGMSDVMPYVSTRYQDMTEEMYKKWEDAFETKIREVWEIFQPDVIFCHHLWLLTALTKKILPQSTIVAISHGTGLRQMKLAPRFAEEVRGNCRKLELIFASNSFQKDEISQVYGISKNKIKVIGNGYNSSCFCNRIKKENSDVKKVVYTGKLAYSKGVLSLLRAIDTIEPKLELILIGSGAGQEAEKIKELAAESKHKITFTGMIAQSQIAVLYQKADVFVLPSFYEGLPLVIIEALACNIPIVCSDLPGIREWLGNELWQTGCIEFVSIPRLQQIDVPFSEDLPFFESNLKKALLKQLSRTFTMDEMNCIQKNIKKFTWENIFSKIETYCQLES